MDEITLLRKSEYKVWDVLENSTSQIAAITIIECVFTDRCVSFLVNLLAKNSPSLQYVCFAKCGLTDEFVCKLAQALEGSSNILHLTVSDRFGKLGAAALAKLCHQNTKLECLCIDAKDSSSSMLRHITNVISTHSSMSHLTLLWDSLRTRGSDVQEFFQVLQNNKTITHLWINVDVPQKLFDECFEQNYTIVKCDPYPRYGWLNRICKQLGATENMRNSIPKKLEQKAEIREVVTKLVEEGEKWNALKIVVLGHGEVGKTTLLHAMRRYQEGWLQQKVDNLTAPLKVSAGVERTVGVDISTMIIGNGEASVWDFGGQLEYTVTHQFLLSIEMVLYIVCYDISTSPEVQYEQLAYWLNFLQSTLPSSSVSSSKWRVIIVGTKSDKCKQTEQLRNNAVSSWQVQWPHLPLHPARLVVSSHKMEGLKPLMRALEQICNDIFTKDGIKIPASYKALLRSIQAIPAENFVQPLSQIQASCPFIADPDLFRLAIKYLHAIGHVVLLKGDIVCTSPQVIPKITAEFISPKDVRDKLLATYNVEILDERQIGAVLEVAEGSKVLHDKLNLMEHIGVCYKLVSKKASKPCYLFPSLASFSDEIGFINQRVDGFKYAGVRIVAPQDQIFTSNFMCRLLVELYRHCNTTRRELAAVHSNGTVLTCQGLFFGQLVVKIEKHSKSIAMLMMAQNPNLAYISSVFRRFIAANFEQYVEYEEQTLCPECVNESVLQSDQIGIIEKGARTQGWCLPHCLHEVSAFDPQQPNLSMLKLGVHDCRTHNQAKHHIFVSYRVATEGHKENYSVQEKSGGLVELVYETLAPMKLDGEDIFVFWDKMCLNLGQNWEEGFLYGITSSLVIVLIISDKVIDGICSRAPADQDNVLVEYP